METEELFRIGRQRLTSARESLARLDQMAARIQEQRDIALIEIGKIEQSLFLTKEVFANRQ